MRKDKGKEGDEVTLQVFGEGKGPEDSIAIAKFPLKVKGGSVSAKWKYNADGREIPPNKEPKFIFSAHSAWCTWQKSGNSLEVELRRPKIEKTEWQDAEGNSINKAVAGEAIKLYAEVTEFEEGQGLTFTVYNGQTQEAVYEAGADVQDGKAEAQWTYHWDGEELKEKPKYYFEVTANRCKNVKSGEVEIGQRLIITLPKMQNIENIKAELYRYGTDKTENISFDSDNTFDKDNLVPGKYTLHLKKE